LRQTLSSIEAPELEPPATPASLKSRGAHVFVIGVTSLMGSCGEILLLMLPTYLTVIGHTANLTSAQLGVVASTASGGLFFGSFLSAFALNRFSSRLIVRTMLGAAAAMQLLLIFAHSLEFVLCATALAAVSGGLAYGTVYAVLSLQSDPARSFAIFVALQLSFNFLLLFIAPYLMEMAGAPLGLFGLLAVCSLIFAALSGAAPNVRTAGKTATEDSQRRRYPVKIALGGFFLFAVGMGATWAYIELVAQGRGFAPRVMEHILSYSQLTALGGAGLAMWVGRSRPNPWLLLAGVAVSSAGVFTIFAAHDLPLFALACLVTGAAWNFSLPFQFATIALLDKSGRAGALASSCHAAGLTVGPLIGTAILLIAADEWTILAASAAMFLAFICFIVPAARVRAAARM
jgi:predicted MFS family arabinose efflux permease